MKKVSALFLVFFVALASLASAQNQASPRITAESPNKMIKVAYGQPSRKGRVLFGDNGLEKYGKVWRTGANQASEVTFAKDAMFGDKTVKAGTYTLFTIPGATEWTVILNGETGQFGAFDYDKTKAKDVAQVKVPAKNGGANVEKLTITPSNNGLTIAWGETSVMVPVKAQM